MLRNWRQTFGYGGALTLVLTGLLFGCGDTNTTTSTAPTTVNQGFNKTGTLQGKIMDATTGAALGGSDLQVYLIQGVSNRTPDKLVTDTNSVLVGEYAFSTIPVNLDAGDILFKAVVIKGGYQRFEGNVSITTSGASNITGTTDDVYNIIGNVYLYPLGEAAGDVDVYVYNPLGTPVSNATVRLRQNINNNDTLAYTGNRLGATGGLVSSLTATTDTDGKATFPAASLVLGGNYSTVVDGLTFQGRELATNTSAAFIIGTNSTRRVITMTTIGNALFATSASNQDSGTITASGVLSITFNQPIILSTTTFTGTMSGGGLPSPQSVTGVLSNNDTTLTLTPTITTAPTVAGATITYTYGGTIVLKNSQAASGNTLFTGGGSDVVNITTGAAVSGGVQLLTN